jgi:hypothetical protein
MWYPGASVTIPVDCSFPAGLWWVRPEIDPESLCIEADSSERAEILYRPRLLGC